MCNSLAFCIYETLLKNLTDNRINQIKKLIKLILRLVFWHVMACLVITVKKRWLQKKRKKIVIELAIKENNKQYKFLYDNIMKHFT